MATSAPIALVTLSIYSDEFASPESSVTSSLFAHELPDRDSLAVQGPLSYGLNFAAAHTFKTFAKELSNSAHEIGIDASRDATTTPTQSLLIPKHRITTIKVSILAHIQAMTPLADIELVGGIAGGIGEPAHILEPLVAAWREAFRQVPTDYPFERVVFDMSCERAMEVDHIRRLLQEIGTVLWMKWKRAGGTRQLKFEVEGVNERKRKWIFQAWPKDVWDPELDKVQGASQA